jgi:hypothetical protein
MSCMSYILDNPYIWDVEGNEIYGDSAKEG